MKPSFISSIVQGPAHKNFGNTHATHGSAYSHWKRTLNSLKIKSEASRG